MEPLVATTLISPEESSVAGTNGRNGIKRNVLDNGIDTHLVDLNTTATTNGHTKIVAKQVDPNQTEASSGAASNGHVKPVKIRLEGNNHKKVEVILSSNQQILDDVVRIMEKGKIDQAAIEESYATGTLHSTSNVYREGEPELACDYTEVGIRFIKAVQEGNLAVVKELEVLFRDEVLDLNHFPVHPLIIIAAFGSSDVIEHVDSWRSATFNWNAPTEIQAGVFEGLLDKMESRNVTPLYVATFLKNQKTVESLIKYTDAQNIAYCMKNIQLSNSIENVYMEEIGKRLKEEYSELKPAVVPGHQKEPNGTWTRVYIVYSTKVMQATNHIRDGIGLVMMQNPFKVTKEAMAVSNSKGEDGDVAKQDIVRIPKSIATCFERLWRDHSNLNIISVRSMRLNEAKTERSLCVVLYCSTKGVVPLGEEEFPKRLTLGEDDYIDVDVREGYFEYGGYETRPSTFYHEELKMGCNIGALTSQNGGGTLGVFVQYNGTMAFLTCAHVLFDIPQQPYVNFTHTGIDRRDVVQPTTDASVPSHDPCGFVQRAIFDPSMDTSIDVAVVTISDERRCPISGKFANDHSYKYKQAGFGELPEYNDGSVLLDIQQHGTSNMVIKFGSETHLTKGVLRVEGTQVRPLSTVLGLPPMGSKLCEVKNQYEVEGDKNGNFFWPGDSGSAVFMLSGTSLHCIGLAIGRTSYGSAVVTPIQPILAALGSDAVIGLQRFDI